MEKSQVDQPEDVEQFANFEIKPEEESKDEIQKERELLPIYEFKD
jgi:hypothetical protein